LGAVYDRGMIVLRDARRDGATAIAAIQERASLAALVQIFPPEQHPFPRDAVRLRWAATLEDPAARVVVANVESEPVGFACVRGDWLLALYVVPEQWGTGVADALYGRALEIVRELGFAHCNLWVLEENTRARRFYERRGWRENGRTQVVPLPPNPLEVGYTLDF
jgi:GNAT superfamily N-acetyltransferase